MTVFFTNFIINIFLELDVRKKGRVTEEEHHIRQRKEMTQAVL